MEIAVEAEAPGHGVVVEVLADLDGSGELSEALNLRPDRRVSLTRERTFTEPGVYFLAARVAAQTDGDPNDPLARVLNIARARVTVTR